MDFGLRRDGTAISLKLPRRLVQWSLDLFYLSISLLVNPRTNATQQSTVDWCLVWNRGWSRGTCMAPRRDLTVDLQLTHIFYRQFSWSYSGDAWGVFCRRIRLGESFWVRPSGFWVASRWDGDRSGTSPTARSLVSRSVRVSVRYQVSLSGK